MCDSLHVGELQPIMHVFRTFGLDAVFGQAEGRFHDGGAV